MHSYFTDLNLDQVVDAIAKTRPTYALEKVYYRSLKEADEIVYRQEVFRDLEEPGLLKALIVFSDCMRSMSRSLESLEKIYSIWHCKGWFLKAARGYRDAAVDVLVHYLEGSNLESRALRTFKGYLFHYLGTDDFKSFSKEIDDLSRDFSEIQYCVTIKDLTVRVRKYDGEIDYGTDIDETIDTFEKEMQFYLSWMDYIGPLRSAGLRFCLPNVSATDKAIAAREVFDLALAKKVVLSSHPIVKNDFSLSGPERIFIVTGPNQGGKTTFARIFGQLHHLASIGCLVPATEARLFLFDRMFSHFEREESLKSHRGKLHEELLSVHASLESATPDSILILNEVFTSTTLMDSIFLSHRIMERIAHLDALCVCVTFLDELASMGEKFVSLVCAVDPRDPAIRTFRIERRPADGLAYARALAERRGLTYEQLKGRIAS